MALIPSGETAQILLVAYRSRAGLFLLVWPHFLLFVSSISVVPLMCRNSTLGLLLQWFPLPGMLFLKLSGCCFFFVQILPSQRDLPCESILTLQSHFTNLTLLFFSFYHELISLSNILYIFNLCIMLSFSFCLLLLECKTHKSSDLYTSCSLTASWIP